MKILLFNYAENFKTFNSMSEKYKKYNLSIPKLLNIFWWYDKLSCEFIIPNSGVP